MKRIRTLIFGIMLATTTFNTFAIQLKTARILSGVVGVTSLASSSVLWKNVHPAYFGLMSAVISALSYYVLYQVTPEGRLYEANVVIGQLNQTLLVSNSFTDKDIFFKALQDIYIEHDLPLISAYQELVILLPAARHAYSLLDKACAEVEDNCKLAEKCGVALSQAQRLINNITTAIKRIRDHKDYLSQLKIYKQFLSAENMTGVQAQIAVSQQSIALSHQQIAGAQKSSNLLRWLQAIFRIF